MGATGILDTLVSNKHTPITLSLAKLLCYKKGYSKFSLKDIDVSRLLNVSGGIESELRPPTPAVPSVCIMVVGGVAPPPPHSLLLRMESGLSPRSPAVLVVRCLSMVFSAPLPNLCVVNWLPW